MADSHYKPRIEVEPGPTGGLLARILCDAPGVDIRYTTDGTEPDAQSALYREPLQINDSCNLRCRGFTRGSDLGHGDERQHMAVHRALHCPVYRLEDGQLTAAPEWQRLTNGCLGRERIFHGFEWTQFTGPQADIVVDLGSACSVSRVQLNFEAGAHRLLFLPSGLRAWLSLDAAEWQDWARASAADLVDGGISLDATPRSARYVRLQIQNRDLHYGPEQRRPITRPVHLDELIIV